MILTVKRLRELTELQARCHPKDKWFDILITSTNEINLRIALKDLGYAFKEVQRYSDKQTVRYIVKARVPPLTIDTI